MRIVSRILPEYSRVKVKLKPLAFAISPALRRFSVVRGRNIRSAIEQAGEIQMAGLLTPIGQAQDRADRATASQFPALASGRGRRGQRAGHEGRGAECDDDEFIFEH